MLPEDALFTSFDYSENIRCAPKRHPHSGSIFESSLLVGFEVTNVNGTLQKTSVCILSDQSAHGWYSAVLAYKQSIRNKKDQFRSRGKTIQKHIVFSDSGPTDIWTGSFVIFATDICNEENVNLNLNRSASEHGKWIHDALIRVVKRKIGCGWKEGLIYILPGHSPAYMHAFIIDPPDW